MFDHISGHRSSGSFDLCQPFSCPHTSVGWGVIENGEFRESNPGSGQWSFTIDITVIVICVPV